jgi:osmotically-inducible protein OsmY
MDSHGKSFYVPALCLAVLALVATSLAGAGALTGCKTAEPARLQVDDATITSMIQAKLAALAAVASLPANVVSSAGGDLKPLNVAVTTHSGVVTLEGRVKKDDTREQVERSARETDGVRRVIDLVKVGDQQ